MKYFSAIALLCCIATVVLAAEPDPIYDHQTQTYTPQFKPVTLNNQMISAMPFFSPDHSIDTITNMIQNASRSIDISTPGFSSWMKCTYFEEGCVGCPVNEAQNETFPVFPALLNAVHRGVVVRLLTNDYKTPTCKSKIAPLDWLAANGVQIKSYATTTFTHSKYTSTDGNRAAISSVNFSYTSYMMNREAGVVLGDGAEDLIAMATQVFEYDWSQAIDYAFDASQYSAAEMAIITSKDPYTVVIPPQPDIHGSYVTPAPTFIQNTMTATIFTSPDFAYSTLSPLLSNAQHSVHVMIYQVTDSSLCQMLIDLNKRVEMKLLVSAKIYDETDWKAAEQCYTQMYSAGVRPRKTPSYYSYSHQKFFMVDNQTISVSTGNFSPSDYPQGESFPPYGNPTWQSVNRDYSMIFTEPTMVSTFQNVMDQDWTRGSDWTPSTTTMLVAK